MFMTQLQSELVGRSPSCEVRLGFEDGSRNSDVLPIAVAGVKSVWNRIPTLPPRHNG